MPVCLLVCLLVCMLVCLSVKKIKSWYYVRLWAKTKVLIKSVSWTLIKKTLTETFQLKNSCMPWLFQPKNWENITINYSRRFLHFCFYSYEVCHICIFARLVWLVLHFPLGEPKVSNCFLNSHFSDTIGKPWHNR